MPERPENSIPLVRVINAASPSTRPSLSIGARRAKTARRALGRALPAQGASAGLGQRLRASASGRDDVGRLTGQQSQQPRDFFAQLAAVDHHVDGALL